MRAAQGLVEKHSACVNIQDTQRSGEKKGTVERGVGKEEKERAARNCPKLTRTSLEAT